MNKALCALLVAACGSSANAPEATTEVADEAASGSEDTPEPVGVVQREAVLGEPGWDTAFEQATIDVEAARALSEVEPGADIDVFLGTWCGDSRREVSRFFKALDEMGNVPFGLRLIAVDRAKTTPEGHTEGQDIRFVPTFIVRREGNEVGRIVESSPQGIERDLLGLLNGSSSGIISGRNDL